MIPPGSTSPRGRAAAWSSTGSRPGQRRLRPRSRSLCTATGRPRSGSSAAASSSASRSTCPRTPPSPPRGCRPSNPSRARSSTTTELLQREQKQGVPGWLTTVAPLGVLVIALGFLAALAGASAGWHAGPRRSRIRSDDISRGCARCPSRPRSARDRRAPANLTNLAAGSLAAVAARRHPRDCRLDAGPAGRLERLADIRNIADSTRVLPDVSERLAAIERRVESLDREVTAMHQAVESIGAEVTDLRDAIHRFSERLAAWPDHRIPRSSRLRQRWVMRRR